MDRHELANRNLPLELTPFLFINIVGYPQSSAFSVH